MRKEGRGFTAVELIVATLLVATMTTVSIPLFTTAIQSYRFNGAVRKIAGDLRLAQALAVANGGYYAFHHGTDASRPNSYRIERSSDGITWSESNAITQWYDLASEFQGITLTVMRDNANLAVTRLKFTSRGALDPLNPSIAPPVSITVTNASGGTRTIQVRSAGSVRIL